MSRRALSDNRDRVGDPGALAAAISGGSAALHMQRAIDLARNTQPHPNPRVGAVLVDGADRVIAAAAHQRAGEPHAEVLALAAAGTAAAGATAYVTLEPCAHQGRTPPCTQALVAAGVRRVVIGALDPDHRVSGRGVEKLENAGIEVVSGVLAEAVESMDPGYFHHRRTGRPLVTLKLAMTLDGQIAAADRTSKWISGAAAREDGHRLRAESDVIIVGAGTVRDDDPRLDVRLPDYAGRQPRPVIIAGARPLPDTTTLLSRQPIVYAPRASGLDVEEVVFDEVAGRVDMNAVIADLGGRGYVTALIEGGATLAREMVEQGAVDRIVFYLAAKLGLGRGIGAFSGEFSTITDAVALTIESTTRIGGDLRIEAKVGS